MDQSEAASTNRLGHVVCHFNACLLLAVVSRLKGDTFEVYKAKMNVLVIFSGLLSIVVASDVLEFNDSNFEDKIKDHSIALVEFFAPW